MNEEPSVTKAELARVLELDAKATQGPIDVWTHETNGEVSYRLRAPAHRNMAWVAQYDDALALAEYRAITPRLARELAAARAAIKVKDAALNGMLALVEMLCDPRIGGATAIAGTDHTMDQARAALNAHE